jgi:hypothetical protein
LASSNSNGPKKLGSVTICTDPSTFSHSLFNLGRAFWWGWINHRIALSHSIAMLGSIVIVSEY